MAYENYLSAMSAQQNLVDENGDPIYSHPDLSGIWDYNSQTAGPGQYRWNYRPDTSMFFGAMQRSPYEMVGEIQRFNPATGGWDTTHSAENSAGAGEENLRYMLAGLNDPRFISAASKPAGSMTQLDRLYADSPYAMGVNATRSDLQNYSPEQTALVYANLPGGASPETYGYDSKNLTGMFDQWNTQTAPKLDDDGLFGGGLLPMLALAAIAYGTGGFGLGGLGGLGAAEGAALGSGLALPGTALAGGTGLGLASAGTALGGGLTGLGIGSTLGTMGALGAGAAGLGALADSGGGGMWDLFGDYFGNQSGFDPSMFADTSSMWDASGNFIGDLAPGSEMGWASDGNWYGPLAEGSEYAAGTAPWENQSLLSQIQQQLGVNPSQAANMAKSLLGGGSGTGGINPLLGAIGGGLLGAFGGQQEAGTIKTMQEPWGPQQPYLLDLFSKAQGALGSAQGLSTAEQQALQKGIGTAQAGGALMPGAQDQLGRTIAGDYLNPESNPYLSATVNKALGDVESRVNSRFNTPAYGNTAHQETLARSLGDTANQMYMQNYGQERNNQMQASQFAPQFAQADLGMTDKALQYGQYGRMDPMNTLKQYQGLIGGNWGQTNTQPYFNNPAAGLLGGAATGYKMFGG